jgi:hypothetical protein
MSVTQAHRDHDELLIVRAAEGDADPVDARLAQEQLAACADCRALFADVSTIRAATNAAVLRVPPRPRSFRIDPELLERRRTPAWRRWLSRLGSPRYDVLRPLAGAVAGIGLAVVVLGGASTASVLPASAPIRDLAGAPAASAAASQPTAEVYAAPSDTAVPAPGLNPQGDRSTAYGPGSGDTTGAASSPPSIVSGSSGSASPSAPEVPTAGAAKAVDSGSGSSPAPPSGLVLGLVGAVLLVAGAGVFLLQSVARRSIGR